jgi:tartrate dehydratase alpha subunit/fumarate hydratase class I-like protein
MLCPTTCLMIVAAALVHGMPQAGVSACSPLEIVVGMSPVIANYSFLLANYLAESVELRSQGLLV